MLGLFKVNKTPAKTHKPKETCGRSVPVHCVQSENALRLLIPGVTETPNVMWCEEEANYRVDKYNQSDQEKYIFEI